MQNTKANLFQITNHQNCKRTKSRDEQALFHCVCMRACMGVYVLCVRARVCVVCMCVWLCVSVCVCVCACVCAFTRVALFIKLRNSRKINNLYSRNSLLILHKM